VKSQELLKELKSFPKEYQPDGDRQRKTLQNIMDFYDEYEKKNKKAFSFQKWQAAAAGLAAVILACFLFLPNILNEENKSHEANPAREKKSIITTPTEEKKRNVISSAEQFHPKELAEVKAISIVNSDGIEIKKVTESALLMTIIQEFKQSQFIEKQNKEKEDTINSRIFYINLEMNGGLVTVAYYPDEKDANFIDIQNRSWWKLEDAHGIFEKLISSNFQDPAQMSKVLNTLYPDIQWDKDYSLNLTDSDKGKVYIATGITPSNQLLQITLDPVTGKVIKNSSLESLADAEKAVSTFFHLVETGNLQMAWDMIHPRSKVPNPGVTEIQSSKSFLTYLNTHQLKLKTINSANWTPNGYKFADCMCTFVKEVLVKVTLTDGTTLEFHVIKDDDDHWKLYWSSIENKLN
jgi:hypothetical protein